MSSRRKMSCQRRYKTCSVFSVYWTVFRMTTRIHQFEQSVKSGLLPPFPLLLSQTGNFFLLKIWFFKFWKLRFWILFCQNSKFYDTKIASIQPILIIKTTEKVTNNVICFSFSFMTSFLWVRVFIVPVLPMMSCCWSSSSYPSFLSK